MISYTKYKTPLCDWIERIPSHWDSQRIKNLFALRDERNYKPLSEVNLISLYASLGVRQHKDIEHKTGNKARNADGYKVVYPNDIVVNILLCWMGAVGRSDYYGVTSPAYDIYQPKTQEINTKYYDYLMRTPMFAQQCYRAGKGIMAMRWRTYSPQFSNIVIPVPPREEQDQIVRFLDWKMSGINKLIGLKQKQISALKEVMYAAIEKQLKDYPIKDTIRLKQLGSFYKGGGFSRDNLVDENGNPAILYGDIYTQYEYKTSVISHQIDKAAYEVSPKISYGDIVMAGTGETKDEIGKPLLYTGDENVAVGGDVIVFHPNEGVNSEYLLYQLYSQAALRHRYINGKGDIIVHIYPTALGNTIINLPSEDDQDKAVERINKAIIQVKKAIDVLTEEISVLKEYSIRLVSDAVTGKIDVRDVNIPEYEYVEESVSTEADGEFDFDENDGQVDSE